MTRKLAAAAACALLLGVGCSKTETATTTGAPATQAQASSGTKAPETTTTEETTTTKKKSGGSTSTTKKSTGTTQSGKKDPKFEKIIESQKTSASKGGTDLSDDETTCLADYLTARPEIIDAIQNPATLEDWQTLFAMISACVSQEKFIDMSLAGEDLSSLTSAQIKCIKSKLMDLSADDFAALAFGDPDATAAFRKKVVDCA